jgi:hypothetical protein
MDAVDKRPEVKLVEGLIINIGRDSLDAKVRSTVCLLLIAD